MKCFEDDHIIESDIKPFFQLIKGTKEKGNDLTKVNGKDHVIPLGEKSK